MQLLRALAMLLENEVHRDVLCCVLLVGGAKLSNVERGNFQRRRTHQGAVAGGNKNSADLRRLAPIKADDEVLGQV
jgi:hypothetical protein